MFVSKYKDGILFAVSMANICFVCDYPTNDFTYIRQRIVCRRCWELMGRDEVITINHSRGEEE